MTIFPFRALTLLLAFFVAFNFASVLAFAAVPPAATPVSSSPAAAAATAVPLEVFVRADCRHCQAEKAWLSTLSDAVVFRLHDIADPAVAADFAKLTARAGIAKATPVTFIGGRVVQGFDTAATTGAVILDLLGQAMNNPHAISLADYLAGRGEGAAQKAGAVCDEEAGCVLPDSAYRVNIPLIGVVDLKKYSLPVLSGLLGFVDGFNPCALWVLITFLVALIQIGDRRKMWAVAGLFIVAETVMYYLILNVWATAWDFIGLTRWVTPAVGLLALGSGAFFLYEGIFSDGTCKVTNTAQRHKIHSRIRELVARPMSLAIAAGVVGLALSVNIIEFACSIGIPQTFTQILQLNQLSGWQQQGLLGIYILFYMLDDFLVFGLALWSFDKIHLTQKYARATNVLGGALMLLLGALLIFRPEWLAV